MKKIIFLLSALGFMLSGQAIAMEGQVSSGLSDLAKEIIARNSIIEQIKIVPSPELCKKNMEIMEIIKKLVAEHSDRLLSITIEKPNLFSDKKLEKLIILLSSQVPNVCKLSCKNSSHFKLSWIKNFKGLEILDLSGCSGIRDADLKDIPSSVEELFLSCGDDELSSKKDLLTDKGLEYLKNVKKITIDNRKKITRKGLKHLKKIENLSILGCKGMIPYFSLDELYESLPKEKYDDIERSIKKEIKKCLKNESKQKLFKVSGIFCSCFTIDVKDFRKLLHNDLLKLIDDIPDTLKKLTMIEKVDRSHIDLYNDIEGKVVITLFYEKDCDALRISCNISFSSTNNEDTKKNLKTLFDVLLQKKLLHKETQFFLSEN